ncbi:Arm DNA-binding domain-containing protein [Dyadobacter sp. BHUBP1]|uniref:Arm DNA-binding domain-containing protein n=1 Tax=Dyadobacter sp. BHUBP1 TaxID=3424178 RepID=UPI003D326A6D
MKIAYYLNAERKKNLYCRISDGSERVTFSLGHSVDPDHWDSRKEEGPTEDPYYFTLLSFKKYLSQRFHELKAQGAENILDMLKIEAENFTGPSGIEGIARKMFDDQNKADDIPSYEEFLLAFEKHSGIPRGEYQPETVDNMVNFVTKEGDTFTIDTYQGLSARLKSFIDERSYDEIVTMTNENIWSQIYIDAGIQKHVFLPVLYREWEILWQEKYSEIKKKVGSTEHLDEMKARSWRELSVFMQCYNDAGDIIELAWEIDSDELYAISVITMLKIFNPESCYTEYCEHELESEDYTSIDIREDDENSTSIFYIKESDF